MEQLVQRPRGLLCLRNCKGGEGGREEQQEVGSECAAWGFVNLRELILQAEMNTVLSYVLKQRSPTFLSQGTGFAEDNLPTEVGSGGGGGMVQAVMRETGSGR